MGAGDDVARFAERAMRSARAVFVTVSVKLVEDAQHPVAKGGRMRVDTGFLRNSLVVDLNGSTSLTGPTAYTLAYGAQLGDGITVGWTAPHALAREFGARGQEPDYFARGAVQKLQQFVKEAADEYS